ncbi:hypothetical protein KFK09_001014 [Dendrobium nobile]|uniref:Uncharacterized protein n=1 Tax=Dendrobium nobile TaxID=94219 RepID=A0A8T3CFI8_DENNO|nr:hypothetical protein KFK09_001014 [Dendrobium nobile]
MIDPLKKIVRNLYLKQPLTDSQPIQSILNTVPELKLQTTIRSNRNEGHANEKAENENNKLRKTLKQADRQTRPDPLLELFHAMSERSPYKDAIRFARWMWNSPSTDEIVGAPRMGPQTVNYKIKLLHSLRMDLMVIENPYDGADRELRGFKEDERTSTEMRAVRNTGNNRRR